MKTLILIGPMGAGKTSVGQVLATCLQWPFVDSDAALLAEAGTSMQTLLAQLGESEFRRRETHLLRRLRSQSPLVLATGGGTVLRAENRRLLMQEAFIVYLEVGLETQLARLATESDRPLLQGVDRRSTLIALNQERQQHYEALAHWRLVVDELSPKTIAQRILEAAVHYTGVAVSQ